MKPVAILLAAVMPALVSAQPPTAIHVDGAASLGPFRPIFAYFGYDEPNYTYMQYGPKPAFAATALVRSAPSLLISGTTSRTTPTCNMGPSWWVSSPV